MTLLWVGPGPESLRFEPALDQCLGGLPHPLLQKPDTVQPVVCLVDFQLQGQGCLPAAHGPTATPFPSCCQGLALQSQDLAAEGQLFPAASQQDRDHEKRFSSALATSPSTPGCPMLDPTPHRSSSRAAGHLQLPPVPNFNHLPTLLPVSTRLHIVYSVQKRTLPLPRWKS